MKATMRSKRNSIGCALAFLGAFPAANALAAFPTIAGDVVSATFGEPNPEDAIFSGVGTSTLTTGGTSEPGFTSTTFSIEGRSFEAEPDSTFSFADLRVFNGQNDIGTTIESAPIKFSVDFSSPGESIEEFDLTLLYEATVNDETGVGADIVRLAEIGSTVPIEIDGVTYKATFLGFTDDGETIPP
jgi:hypothetical protein